MKRLLKTLALAAIPGAALTLQTSCGPDPVPDPELTVSTGLINFGSGAGDQTFRIKTNVPWSISGTERLDWLNVTPGSGEGTGTIAVKVAVFANPLPQTRNVTLTVTAGGLTEPVTVTQGYADVLDPEKTRIEGIPAEGATVEVKLKTSDPPSVTIGKEWITADGTGTPSGDYNTVLKFKVDPFDELAWREGTITVRVGMAEQTVTLVQDGVDVGIAPDQTGMDDNAMAMAAKMGLGWNLGNTLEPPFFPDNPYYHGGEGSWTDGQKATKELIEAVAAAGFKNIRIPCAWDGYLVDREKFVIDPVWLDRVAEVVGWCLEEDLYTTINIHWDGGWLQEHPFYADQKEVNRKMTALWKQIGVRMRDFDGRLTFAGTNEVQVNFGAPSAENLEVQESFNQTFVNAVRSTGGKNAYRNLVVQAYNTHIDYAVELMTLPEESVEGRLFVEVHYYDPYEFSIMPGSDTGVKLVWGNRPEAPVPGSDPRKPSWGDENFADAQFAKMKSGFVDKGIPVIVGEYGGTFRTGLGADQADHDASNVYFLGYLTGAMVANGLIPVYWDNGAISATPSTEGSGLFDRKTCKIAHPEALDAIMNAKNNRPDRQTGETELRP